VSQEVDIGYTDTFLELKKDIPQLDDIWPCAAEDNICIKSYIVRKVDVETKAGELAFADKFFPSDIIV